VNKNSSSVYFNIRYGNKKIANTCNTKFLGQTLNNTLSWKNHIDTIIPKLSSENFAIRAVKPSVSQDSLRTVYYSYIHSIMTYGLIFWGNSHYNNTDFRLKNILIRIVVGIIGIDSYRENFKKLKILSFQSEYILSHLLFCD